MRTRHKSPIDAPMALQYASRDRRALWLLALLALLALLLVSPAYFWLNRGGNDEKSHVVGRGDIVVRCQFSATLTSVKQSEIVCDVAAHSDSDGRQPRGAELLWIAANGAQVQAGDLLAEFDATTLRELVDTWQLKLIKSEGIVKQVSLRQQNVQSKHDTELANATNELQLILEAGDQIDDIQQTEIRELLALIKLARHGAKAARLNAEYVEAMDRRGLADRLTGTLEQAKVNRQEATNSLAQMLGQFKKLTHYDQRAQREEWAANAVRARRALAQSQRNFEALNQQLLAEKQAAIKMLEREQDRVEYYKQQLAFCKVYAPFSGLVAHVAPNSEEHIFTAGMMLHERQKILVLHDLTQLVVRATLHSTSAQYLQRGLVAVLHFQAGSRPTCTGTVTEVQQRGTHADVTVTPDKSTRFAPGSLAEVDIVAKRCHDVLRIPVTSLFRWDDRPFCFVHTKRGLEQRRLQLGVVGSQFAEVLHGLSVGDSIVLDATTVATTLAPSD